MWITGPPMLDSRQVPHDDAAAFSPVFLGGKVYFLSARKGRIGVFAFDPATGMSVKRLDGASMRTVLTDRRLRWLEIFSERSDGSIYLTASHIQDSMSFKLRPLPAVRPNSPFRPRSGRCP